MPNYNQSLFCKDLVDQKWKSPWSQ